MIKKKNLSYKTCFFDLNEIEKFEFVVLELVFTSCEQGTDQNIRKKISLPISK